MRNTSRWTAALCAAVSVMAGQAAGAQTFTGTANGCFGAGCTPTAGGTYQSGVTAGGGMLTFNNATFNTNAVGGMVSFGGTPVAGGLNTNNFGSFTLGNGTFNFGTTPFNLLLTFTAPGGSTTLFAPVMGSVVNNGSSVFVDFGSNGFGMGASTVVSSAAGSFTLTVNDVALSPGSTNDIKGMASNFQGSFTGNPSVVPEPGTYALLATGLLGLAGVARRKRTAA